jgi:Right handed beta helix region
MSSATSRQPLRFADGVKIRLLDHSYADRLLLFNDSDDIAILNCRFQNCVLRFAGCRRIQIFWNVFNQCYGSHFIQFAPSEHCENVVINGNTFTGAFTPFYRDSVGGQPVNNNACGDVIAIRNVHRFAVTDNIIAGGGEFGITVLHGSKDGVIANNRIDRNDATAIFIGNDDGEQIQRISVVNNTLSECGLNGAGNASNQMAIRIQNAADIAVCGNVTVRPGRSLLYGLTASQCDGLTVANNFSEVQKPFRIPKIHKGSVTRLTSDIQPTY